MVTPSVHDGAMSLVISCDECAMQHTDHCQDCVVTFLCDDLRHERTLDDGRRDAVIIDADEERAVRMLGRVGLVPVLRHRPQTTCA